MDQHTIEHALTDLPFSTIRYYPVIDSTNNEAARWADQGAPDLALVIADEQTAGRGRAGRRWYTLPGSALAFSLVLYPQANDAQAVHQLTALGALAVQTALQEYFALPAQIKWPNDVLIDRSKVAGVLSEAHWIGDQLTHFILGIGINIAPPSIAWPLEEATHMDVPVTCMQDAVGKQVDRLEVLHEVLKELLSWRTHLGTPDFITAWDAALAFRHEWVAIYHEDVIDHDDLNGSGARNAALPSSLKGQVLGLTENGGLILRSPAGVIYNFNSGEVRLRPVIKLNTGT
jgi:BirA family transcriptional regulator, biotin operon repressor / biotin---[acetyl-CoA-carboxylase] ligase